MLELQHVSYSVTDESTGKTTDILRDVNLVIDDRFVAITGPNGSGKSTLAKIIAGIITPTSGRILFQGQDITELGITERANLGISYAFQQPVRFKGITVKDLISIAAGKDISVAQACAYLS
jgi:Fe-S cluster assembly ATP-binding protein